MVAGRDVIAQLVVCCGRREPVLTSLSSLTYHLPRAQSGTGKTATFAIAMLQKVDIQLRETQALVLSPTRELAVQIQKVSVFFTLSSPSSFNFFPYCYVYSFHYYVLIAFLLYPIPSS
jgi:hypothetical protein